MLSRIEKLKFSVLVVLWVFAFLPIYQELFHTWLNSPNNSHGILVPIISGYLIWRKRRQLVNIKKTGSLSGVIVLSVSLAIYIIAYAGSLAVVCRTMIVFSLIGLVMAYFGTQVTKQLLFPLLFLLFMVPVPDSIYTLFAFPLQLFATKVSTSLIQAIGISAYREGNMVYFANTQLEIAEACSGLRSMMAFLMLASLFAYLLNNEKKVKRVLMIMSAIPLALVANIFRVTGTGILASIYGDKVARGFLHEFSGLAVFATGFIIMYFEFWLLDRKARIFSTN